MHPKRSYRLRLLLGIFILGSCVGCDQVTKSAATQLLRNAPPRTYFSNTVRLEYALNPGGFLSLGSQLPDAARKWLFIGFNSCMLLALSVILLLKRDLRLMQYPALLLILAGGVGNMIDRIGNEGLVTDFINLGIGPVRTGIFNVADIAVSVGAVMIGYLAYRPAPQQIDSESAHQ